jgi:hypothetical protein
VVAEQLRVLTAEAVIGVHVGPDVYVGKCSLSR